MPDAILIQQASWEQSPLLDVTAKRHSEYARKHQMTFEAIRGRLLGGAYAGWDKFVVILQALQAGFEHVFWVDADAAVVGEADLRDALMVGDLGMVQHPGPPAHFNCGVMLMHNTPEVAEFFTEADLLFPGKAPWWEQEILNSLIETELLLGTDDHPGLFERLDDRWNSTAGVNAVADPVIWACHGYGDVLEKAALMRCVLGNR